MTFGWDHDVVVINENHVFRFPDEDHTDLAREIALLEALRGKTTLPIPCIDFVGRSARYVGYRMLRGEPLSSARYAGLSPIAKARCADDLAQFLTEVHAAISIDQAKSLGLELDEYRSYVNDITRLQGRIDDGRTVRFIDDTIREAEWRLELPAAQTFLYNDLHGDNMAFDEAEGRLSGIFDFGDVAHGDIHRDFSTLFYIDRGLFEATVAAYCEATGQSLSRRQMMVWYRLERLADLSEILGSDSGETARILREIERGIKEPWIYADDP